MIFPSLPLSPRYPSSPDQCAATPLLCHRPSTTRAPACLLPTGIVASSSAPPPLSRAARPPLLLPHRRSTAGAGAQRQGRGSKPRVGPRGGAEAVGPEGHARVVEHWSVKIKEEIG